MSEGKFFGVQKMAAEIAHVRAQASVLDRVVATTTVGFIANNRMFQPRKMDADLVSPAGLEHNIEQREAIEMLPYTE